MHPCVYAQTTPEKPAYIMAATGEIVTYKALDERSNQCAQFFRAQGLKVGDHIALLMENHIRFYEICWGAQRAGLFYTAISTRLTAPEAAYIINDCGAELLITTQYMAPVASELAGDIPGVECRLMVDGIIDGYESYEDLVHAMPTSRIADETAGADMLYSSGTTGRPKGVKHPLTGEAIDWENPLFQVTKTMYRFDDDVIYLSPAPLYHAAPMRFNMTIMRFGGTSVIMDNFNEEESLALIERYGITHSQWVPTMFVRMLKMPADVREKYDLSSLKVAVHAAAPCPVDIKKKMIDWWGPVLLEYYAGSGGMV